MPYAARYAILVAGAIVLALATPASAAAAGRGLPVRQRLAKQGVVVVSFNYRLGRFGFFAHPGLTGESAGAAAGNYGFMDQLAALQWVQRRRPGACLPARWCCPAVQAARH